MTTTDTPSEVPSPIQSGQRIESIDVLRGVAVLGILALNIQSFAMPGSAYMNPFSYGDLDGLNYWIWYVIHLLGDMKFWTIFSMLFGAGILVMTGRCEATGRSAAGVHYRRMIWLMIIGILHAHLIWYGDILFTYAVCGMMVFWVRKWRPRWLIVTGIALLMVAFLIALAFGAMMGLEEAKDFRNEMSEAWTPSQENHQQELDTYRGSWLEQLPKRSMTAVFMETFLFAINFGWRSAGLMLIGMALFKLDVFSASRSSKFYGLWTAIAVFVGLPTIAYGVYQNHLHDWSVDYSFYFGNLYNYWASVLVAVGWISVVMLVCQSPGGAAWTRPFAAAGRMALTCYLLQSIIATTIFYGHGLGQFGFLERWQQFLVVIAIWCFCLVFATLWLKRFRFGPFEWLWRSLTYMKWQPIRKPDGNRDTV